jgi:hypothetical protein
MHHDREAPSKTTIHRLTTKLPDTGNVCDKKHVRCRAVLAGEELRFNVMGGRPTSKKLLQSCLVSALLGVTFGHRDLHTSPRQPSFCYRFLNERIWVTHKAWRKWNTVLDRLLPTAINKHFAVSRNVLKIVDACLREGEGHFQIRCKAVNYCSQIETTTKTLLSCYICHQSLQILL